MTTTTDRETTSAGRFAMYSATRQWNPGDEFILTGARRIVDYALGNYQPLLYDRNPDVRPSDGSTVAYRNIRRPLEEGAGSLYEHMSAYLRLGFFSNSVKFDSDLSYASLAVLAGSPEWATPRCWSFYDHVFRIEIPLMGLGLGSMPAVIPDFIGTALAHAPVLTTRSKGLAATELAKRYGIEYLPCPALLSAPQERQVTRVEKVGIAIGVPYQGSVWANGLDEEFYAQVTRGLDSLLENYAGEASFEFVAHYIDEIPVIQARYPGIPIRYSFASEDYARIFGEYDLVISTRVHACGLAASSGIPSISIGHDFRSDTTEGFLSSSVDIDASKHSLVDAFVAATEEASAISAALAKHKSATLNAYAELITPRADSLSARVDYGPAGQVRFTTETPTVLPGLDQIEQDIARVLEDADDLKAAKDSNDELRAVLSEVERSKAEMALELDGARAAVVRLEDELSRATAPRPGALTRLRARARRLFRRE